MIKKLLLFILITFLYSNIAFAQPLNVTGISANGRFSSCANYVPPTIVVNFLSGNGSSVNALGQLVCSDPCDSTKLNVVISNIRFDQGADAQWLHGLFFPTNAGYIVSQQGVAPFTFFTTCTGSACSAGITGGQGFYYDGYVGGTSCCGFSSANDGNPGNNWGVSSINCGTPFTLNFNLTLCNSIINSVSQTFKLRGTADGGTGCWGAPNNQSNNIQFTIGTIACSPLYSPNPTATRTKTCLPALNYTATLTGGCGNSNLITWWTASTGGTQVGSGSPFVYDPPGTNCPPGTLYASCCPVGTVCASRKAFAIPGSCSAPLSIDSIYRTEATCAITTASIDSIHILSPTGAVSYNLMPGNITNTTGIFLGLTGSSYTVTVTDALGCNASYLLTLPVPICGAPITAPITYCLNAPAVPLTATLTAGGSNLLWYTTLTAGAGSSIAPTPITTALGITTYYVTQNVNGLESTPRTPLDVTVVALPAPPVVTTPVTYCQNATATALTATGSNLLWYNTLTGGIGSATTPIPSTSTVGNTLFYVSQTVGTCESTRATITVTIEALPAAPIVTTPVTYCLNATAAPLTATGTNLLWYNVATGGTGFAFAPTPGTTTVGSTTYYVSQTVGTCESPRAAIVVDITALPTAPTVTTPVTYCQNATATPLTATGTNLLWYTASSGGASLPIAPTPITTIAGSTTYYVSQTVTNCEGPRAAIVVNITALPAAPTVTTPVTYCQNDVAVALTATGTNLLWYNVAIGGASSATAPTPITTTIGSTNYYVSQTVNNCEGARALIVVTIVAPPLAPIVTTPVVYCQNATATTLTATGTNLQWYTVSTGGAAIPAPTPATTITGSTTYYVSQTAGTCVSPRAAIVVTINPTPAAPVVTTPILYCQNDVAIPLTATGTNLLWYTVPVNGIGSTTSPTPTTTTIGSTTYYVSSTLGICEGPRAAIVVTISTTPAAPGVTSPVIYCQNASATALTAIGTGLQWYTVNTGGVPSTTIIPTTTTVGSTLYYVSASVGSCEGPRTPIMVTINAIPAAPTVTTPVVYCQNATATALSATGSNLLWYTVASGGVGSATAPTPITTSAGNITYYVSQTVNNCESPRSAILITINPTPAAPTVTTPIPYCQAAIATALTATGNNLLWYNAPANGVGSTTAPIPSTATGGITTYYVSQTINNCEGPRAAIVVDVTATPVAPTVASPVVYCQNATATALTATGSNLLWYTVSAGGASSTTAPTPSTLAVGNTIYYVSQTINTCEGPRAAITVTINPIPAAPAAATLIAYCQNATATALSATGTNLLWYTVASGGAGSAIAPTPTTTTAGNTTYYVSQTVNNCESPRSAILITINPTPAAPTVTTPIPYCQAAIATALTATGSNLLWYNAPANGLGSTTAPTPSTATGGTTTYYVSQTTNNCEGPRAAIVVDVTATPASPSVTSPVIYCQNATATALTATGSNLLWYTVSAGGVSSTTAPTPSTLTVGNTIYYVSQTINTCEGPRAAITVTINTTPPAPIVASTPVLYCQNATATSLTATGTNLLWYTVPTLGTSSTTAPIPSTTTVGNTIYYVSQTVGICEGPRAAITVTVNTTPAAPTVTSDVPYCQGATATPLTAAGTNLLWYTVPTLGASSATAPTPSTALAGITTYYVSSTIGACEGPRAAITVTVTAIPAAPTVTTPVVYCQGLVALPLSATGSNLLWYTVPTNGTSSATAPTPNTSTVGNTIYYVSQSVNNCEGPRAAITVTINPTPAAPLVSATPVVYCQNATTTALIATGTNLLWYTVPSGGISSSTAPIPSSTTAGNSTYYVSQTTGICEGPRASILVTINATPTLPVVTTPIAYCQGATATALSATGSNLLWYTVPNAGTSSATAPTPSTASGGSTTYYVSQTINNCEGPREAIVVNVTATPALPIVTSPITYCQLSTPVALAATGTNLLWYTVPVAGTSSNTAPTPSTLLSGNTNYYVSQSTNNCEGPRALITVVVNAKPAAPGVSNVAYCQNTATATLTVTGTNLLWYNMATGGTGTTTAPAPSSATAGATDYYVTQSTLNCESDRAIITVTITATPAAPTVTSPVTYCPGDPSTALTATGTNLLWYNAATGGVGSTTAPTPSTTTPSTVTYYVSQSANAAGTLLCEGPRAAIVVNVNNNNLTVNIGTDTTICEGEKLKLEPVVTPPATIYQWRAIAVPLSTIDMPTNKDVTVTPVDNATYILKATIGGCATEDTINVLVKWKPLLDAGLNKAICLNDSFLIKGVLSHFVSSKIDFAWSPTDSLTTPTSIQTWAHPTKSTWYKLTATTTKLDYGCDFVVSDSVKLVIQPIVKAFAGNDTIAVKGVPHQLQGSGGLSYVWFTPSAAVISNPFSQNAFATLNNDANFYLKVSDAVGCTAYDTVFVKVYDGPTYYIPNSFTPNGDGLNDIFRPIPVGISYTNYFRVFNRFGELLFETNQWLKGWDGTFKGQQQPNGAYVWMIAGTDKYNKKIEMKGSVMIIR